MKQSDLKTDFFAVALILFAVFLLACGLCSCNITRRTTVESSYYTKGDTAVSITTKTVESYDATKKINN